MGEITNHYIYRMMAPRMGANVFGVLLLWLGLLAAVTALFMWLWNITITRIFGIREITFWEAFRLIIIAGILFGGGSWFRINF